ncbi:MAG: FecR domain-containing protein [Acidobacteriota bacterium]
MRRHRRQRAGMLLVLAAGVLMAVGWFAWPGWGVPEISPQDPAVFGRVVLSGGPAWVVDPSRAPVSSAAPLRTGTQLLPGATVRTEGQLALSLRTGHSLRLDRGTQVRIQAPAAFVLERGAVYVDSVSPAGSSPTRTLVIEVAGRTIRDVGTQFEVRLMDGAEVRVRVREGAVLFDGETGSTRVKRGQELHASVAGLSVVPAPLAGPDWDWVAEVTPMINLDGRTVRSYLDWLVRERGWRLVFDDPGLANQASEIRLSGDLEGATLVGSLDAILPTCDLAHQFDPADATLHVRRAVPAQPIAP